MLSLTEGYLNWGDEPEGTLPFDTPTNFRNKITLTTQDIAAHDPPRVLGSFLVTGSIVVSRFEFMGVAHKITIRILNSHDIKNRITYFDEKGSIIESNEIPITLPGKNIVFSTTKHCAYFELSVFDYPYDGGIGIYWIEWGQ